MQFLSPTWLLLGLLAIPIIALYMLKLRRKKVQVSSTLLWTEVLRDRQANTFWQRLKRNILLILQLIILFGLVLALARPAFPVASLASGSLIILIDASASMAATDVKPNRFEVARDIVGEMIAKLESNNQMTVIQVARQAEILANGESDREILLHSLQKANVSQGSADWQTAFALAAGAVSSIPENLPVSILIISDGGLLGKNLPPLPAQVRYIRVGQSNENVAISAFSMRHSGNSLELFTSVKNYGDSDQKVLLSIETDGVLSFAKELSIPADQRQDLVLKDLPSGTRIAKAILSAADGTDTYPDMLTLDNFAYAVNSDSTGRDIYLLTSDYYNKGDENQFLISILDALGLSAKRPLLDRQTTPRIPPALPEEISNLYIFDGIFSIDSNSGQPALPEAGNILLINPPVISINGLITVTGVTTPGLTTTVLPDTLTDFLNWDDIFISQTKVINIGPWAKTLVRSGDIPLVMAGEYKNQRIAVIGFDLHDSDLPLQIAYPVLLVNLLDYLLAPQTIHIPEQGLQAGEKVEINLSPGIKDIIIGKPDQTFVQLPLYKLSVDFIETTLLGLYAVNLLGENKNQDRVEYFAINLFDPIESEISPSPVIEIGQGTFMATGKDTFNIQETWIWPAGLAFIILILEWEFFHRRMSQLTQSFFAKLGQRNNSS